MLVYYLQLIETPENRSKFDRLYHAYQGLMFHIAKGILRNDQDAEDAVHEAFLKIAKNILKISDAVCPKTRFYIVQVVESTSIDLWRKKQRELAAEPLEDHPGVAVEYHGENRVTQCILDLPPHDREVLLLRFDQGYSLRETAKLLDITEDAARKREQRAKERLEARCREEGLM